MNATPMPSTVAHLDAIASSADDGWFVISALKQGRWVSASFGLDQVDEAAQMVADLDAAGLNVYVRTNLLGRPLNSAHERGRTADTAAAIAFAVDIDVAGPGHAKPSVGRLAESNDEALSAAENLPAPSMLVATGGGVHLWWFLDRPILDQPVAALNTWADRIVESGRIRGFNVDRPDPARVLRVCGSHRRKPDIPPNRVTLADAAVWPPEGLAVRPWQPARYNAAELLSCLPKPAPKPTPAPPKRSPQRRDYRSSEELSPADIVSTMSWARILEPAGWELVGNSTVDGTPVELWRRPGSTSKYSMKCFANGTAIAWSDAAGLPAGPGQRLTKWRVAAWLHHGGDESKTAKVMLELWKGAA